MPLIDEDLLEPLSILERMTEEVELEAAGGEVVLANNRFELLTLGHDKMKELKLFADRDVDKLTGLFSVATLSGNSIVHSRSIFMSMMLSLGTTSLLVQPLLEEVGTFIADSAAVTGTVTLRPRGNVMIIVATRPNQCEEAGNMVVVQHN
jgi:hypothetical protein